jgi:hypothetical protein
MYEFFNNTSLIGSALSQFDYFVAGDGFITLFLLTCFIFLIGMVFRFPLEWLAISLVPLAIYFVAIEPRYYVVGGLLFIFVAFIMAKNFWFNIK